MNEEKIIKKANLIIENHREIDKMMVIEMVDLVQGLLDLYNKEKEKNKELEKENWIMRTVDKQYISKEKIREKIEELESIEPADDDYNFELQNDIHSKLEVLHELL